MAATGSDKKREALLRDAVKRFDSAWEADRANREEALQDLKFYVGEQWPDDLKQERESENRPVVTENRLPQFVRQITAEIRQQRPAIRVRPVDDEADPKVAEVMTSLIRDIEGQSATLQPYVKAAESAVKCGIGHFRIVTEYSRIGQFEQEIKLQPIDNPFAVVWDPLARDVTREDAGYCFVTERMTHEAFKAAYPKATVADFDKGDLAEAFSDVGNWYDTDTVRVAEYFYHEPVKRTFARFSDGKVVELVGDDPIPPPEAGVEVREIEDRKVCYIKMSGLDVLEGPTDWLTRDIPIIPVLGEETNIGDRVVRVGAVRYAREPQFLFNVWLSTQTELLGLQPKAPYLATAKQIEGYEQHWREANEKNRPVLLYNPDGAAGGPPQRMPPPMASPAIADQIAMASDAMKATTGVYDAALGAQSNETSGKAIQARQQQSSLSSFVFTDNLTASVRRGGQIILDLIPQIYNNARVVRILGEDGAEEFKRINVAYPGDNGEVEHYDLTAGRYDLTINTGPAYATKRQEAADSMMQFIQTAPQAAPLVMDLIAKNMDWPGADQFAERFKKALPPGIAPKEQDDSAEAQAEAQAKAKASQMQEFAATLELRKANAETEKAEAEADEARFKMQMTQLELAAKQSHAMRGDHTFGQADEQARAAAVKAPQGAPEAAPQEQEPVAPEETGQPPADVLALPEPPPQEPVAPLE